MTIEEKVGQLETPLGWEMYRKSAGGIEVSDRFVKMMEGPEPGSLYGVLRADPWTKVTLQSGLSPSQAAEATNAIQKYAISHSRLHIPLLIAEEWHSWSDGDWRHNISDCYRPGEHMGSATHPTTGSSCG